VSAPQDHSDESTLLGATLLADGVTIALWAPGTGRRDGVDGVAG
jgi:hypothetical protein